MENNLESALQSSSESIRTEFKESFDISSPQEWCELIKDIVAIANTEGGVILIGVDNSGVPVDRRVSTNKKPDPADITNKINKYTGYQFSEFAICSCEKTGHDLIAIIIQNISVPIIFNKPGTYDIGDGKQKTAFGTGTVYFRHGAKSEPGNTNDLQHAFEKKLEVVREA
jgi:predicted HTH transcriptional regulator